MHLLVPLTHVHYMFCFCLKSSCVAFYISFWQEIVYGWFIKKTNSISLLILFMIKLNYISYFQVFHYLLLASWLPALTFCISKIRNYLDQCLKSCFLKTRLDFPRKISISKNRLNRKVGLRAAFTLTRCLRDLESLKHAQLSCNCK